MANNISRVKAQTAIRHKLLDNGYSFFPCKGKAGQRQGWPNIAPTPELIEQWGEELAGLSTALHVGLGGLVMVDWDIDDPVLAELVEDMPDDLWAAFGDAPVRRSGKLTEAWAVRLADTETRPPYMLRSLGFTRVPGDKPQRLELFLRHPKVFVAYGAHTIDERGEITREYAWDDDRGPHTVPVDELPEVTLAQVERLVRWVNDQMAARGWLVDKSGAHGRVEAREIYDLHEGMTFSTAEGAMTLADLRERVEAGPLFLSASFKDGRDDLGRNHRRCQASLRFDGHIQVFDFGDYCSHLPVELNPDRDYGADKLARLRDMAAAAGGGPGVLFPKGSPQAAGADGEGDLPPLDARAAELLQTLAFTAQDRCAIPLDGSPPMSMGTLRHREAPYELRVKGPRGGQDVLSPADLWLRDPARIDVAGAKFNPATDDTIFEDSDGRWVNLWKGLPPDDGAEDFPDAPKAFETFLRHLLPDAREREWFKNWLAVRVQHPMRPSCAVLMRTPVHGSGRGTLFDILTGVLGDRHVSPVTSLQLMGGQGQGQYNDWLETALLVTCDEVSAGADTGANMRWKRQDAYERLKSLIDPRARNVTIVRKGLPNYRGAVFAGFLLATNNDDALPFAEQDRRIAVLTNAMVKLVDNRAAWAAVESLRDARGLYLPGAMASLRVWLRGLPCDASAVREAPLWTEGRASMLEANKDSLDDVFEAVMQTLTDQRRDFITFDELLGRLRVATAAAGIDGDWRNAVGTKLGGMGLCGWRRYGARINSGAAGSPKVRVYYRVDGLGMERLLDLPVKDRAALLHGPRRGRGGLEPV